MLKISEFAKLANTTRRTLIFYDEKGIFSPVMVADNGYRYYEADQLYQFELISRLRQLGLSLDEIKYALSSTDNWTEHYLIKYQQKIKDEIKRLQKLDKLLEAQKNKTLSTLSYDKIPLGEVVILSSQSQEFWCTDLAVDCQPEDIAQLYSKFITNLGELASRIPSQLGFLTNLPLLECENYMSASFRFIKEITPIISHNLITKIDKPSGQYISIKVNTNLEEILEGLVNLKHYVEENKLNVYNFLWQINTSQHLVKNGSSAQQILQYQIKEDNNL